jgi:hypothetical protein
VLVLVPVDIEHADLNRELGADVADGPDKVGVRDRGGNGKAAIIGHMDGHFIVACKGDAPRFDIVDLANDHDCHKEGMDPL